MNSQLSTASSTHPYLHVGSARDLSGRERVLYRALEILPGFISYGTLLGFIALSFVRPEVAAYVTIAFAAYWLFKTLYLSIHLRYNFRRLRHAMDLNWSARLESLRADELVHLVIFPFYKEGYDVLSASIDALARSRYDLKKVAIVIAAEARAGESQVKIAERAREKYSKEFLDIIVTVHPDGIPGELAGKGSNISYAAREAKARILDSRGIRYENVLVSAFDVDTVAYPQYFACLSWHFLTCERPHQSSFQPVPLYNNNIWHAPTLSRVLAYSSTFWQMIQQERPEKLATFSSHAISFKALLEAGYWQRNIVSEDSRIYWNLFMFNDGNYEVVPLSYPVSMDANIGRTWWATVGNLYRQHRRWTWGVENVPYIIYGCIKNPRIPLRKKIRAVLVQLEGFWSLATHPIILFLVGWMPLIVGGHTFNVTVLSYNLPIVAKAFLTVAMVGLIFSAIFTMYLIPKRPTNLGVWRNILMVLQWVLVPLTMVIFSAIPGLETQGRLLLGRYMGFWVTPKGQTAAQEYNSQVSAA